MRVVEEMCCIDDNMEVRLSWEASGGSDNRRDKDGNGGRLCVTPTTSTAMGFKKGIRDNKIGEMIVGTNLVISVKLVDYCVSLLSRVHLLGCGSTHV